MNHRKNVIIFVMILSDLMTVLASENIYMDKLNELSKLVDSARDMSYRDLTACFYLLDYFLDKLKNTHDFLFAGLITVAKFQQLMQCLSVLDTADYSQLPTTCAKLTLKERSPVDSDDECEGDENDNVDSTPKFHETLHKLGHHFHSLSCAGFRDEVSVTFQINRSAPSYEKDRAELLWIFQEHKIDFENPVVCVDLLRTLPPRSISIRCARLLCCCWLWNCLQ